MFLVLIVKFDQKSNFHPDWLEVGYIRAKYGPNGEKNMVLKSQEWYYIVSMYKYYQLILFRVFIKKFDQKSNF